MPETNEKDKYQGILNVSEKRKLEENTSIDEEMVKIVIFTLCGKLYAFYGSYVKSILPYDPVTPVPGCPNYISGIINVRGDIESVINIHSFMGLTDDEPTEKTRIVIAKTSDVRSGVLVNSVEDVVDIPVSAIAPPVSTLDDRIREFIAGELFYREESVTLLDIKKMFQKVNL